MVGVLKLFRTPLLEGEPLYVLGGIEQGVVPDGEHKGEKRPKLPSVAPKVMEDGTLCWEMLDTEANRKFCRGFLPQKEDPPFAYSIGYPEDEVDEGQEVEVLDDSAESPKVIPTLVKKPGRKKKSPGGK